ncbi:hypothetical protein SLA2020_266030 [Shorea laevis]
MDDGDDARRNIIREIDGFRICLLGHHGAFLQVSEENPIGIACKPLLPQPPLQVFRPHPHPIQNPPATVRIVTATRMKIAATDTSISRRHKTCSLLGVGEE